MKALEEELKRKQAAKSSPSSDFNPIVPIFKPESPANPTKPTTKPAVRNEMLIDR